MRRAAARRPKGKPNSTVPCTGARQAPGRELLKPWTIDDGFPSLRTDRRPDRLSRAAANGCFVGIFYGAVKSSKIGIGIATGYSDSAKRGCIMKLQFGQNQLVLEISKTPFAWFHGHTERMSLTSLSLMFVQFSLFARQPAARCN